MNKLPILLIQWYQQHISPRFPARCRFYPTCSQYALEAYRNHPFLRATALTVWRLLRCQPCCRGGIDPVPAPKKKGN